MFRTFLSIPIFVALVSGCDNSREVLELRRDQLLQVERGQIETLTKAEAGLFERENYDAHLFLSRRNFDSLFNQIGGISFQPDERFPITVSLESPSFDFRSGYPEITLSASAVHTEFGISADLEAAAAIVIVGSNPTKLKVVVTEVEPNLRWKWFQLRYLQFVRQLAQIEVFKYSQQLPAFELPEGRDVVFGGPPQRFSTEISAGNSVAVGQVSVPGLQVNGQVVIEQVLFLRNGVHLYGNLRGI